MPTFILMCVTCLQTNTNPLMSLTHGEDRLKYFQPNLIAATFPGR